MTLYLKYRPQDFESLVGQSFIKDSLQAAVQNDKTVGAYLFTGPRGTGKTSTARIFAKAINCLNPEDGNPCGRCGICKAFSEGRLIDIIEIDAASYTGVDNIREIIERAQFQPTQCKYKVYIIDEVHMLSKGAFNALLKILEEPPKHVKFILATTDIHKVPETILSRCQRYDFRSITDADMRARLQFVADEEGITIDTESLEYIISEARGGLRNALTLFEQLIVDSEIRFTYIESTLGVASATEKQSFALKLLNRDLSLLSDYETMLEKGKNPSIFIKSVLFLLQKQAEEQLINGGDIGGYIEILEILQKLLGSLKYSFDESLLIKISLLKILSGYTETQTSKIPIKNIPLPKEAPQVLSNQDQVQNTQEVQLSDVEDIFGGENSQDITSQEEKTQDKAFVRIDKNKQVINSIEVSSLDIATLITEAKKLGAKAAVTMSLKPAIISISGTTCSMQTKTKIAREQLLKSENKTLLLAALQNISPEITSLVIS